jgi:tape measure domain-containing protein
MALSAGAVVAKFDGDFKGLNKGLKDAQGKVNGFGKDIQRAGKKIGDVFKSIGKTAINYSKILGAAGAAATVFGVKTASELQTVATNFEVLTGSAEKGRKVFQDLRRTAATTPFGVQDLAKATQTMLSFGLTVEESSAYLNQLGDVSLGNREKLGALTLAFARTKANGRLMGEELEMMIDRGFNPLEIISQKTGKSMLELRGEMSKGKISFNQVEDALISATSEGGRFYKGMERGSQTLAGTFSTLRDNIGNMAAGLAGLSEEGTIVEGSLLDLTQRGVIYLNQELGKINWVKVGEDISNNFKKAIDDTAKAIENLINWYKDHKIQVEIAMVTLGSFVTSFAIVKTAITLYTIAISIATIATGGFAAVVAFITSPITIAVVIIAALIGLLYTLWRNWGALTAEGTFLGNKIQWVKDKFNQLKDSINGMIQALGNIRMPKALTDILDKMKGLGNVPGLGALFGGRGKLPGFANGVRNFGGGFAVVGERGPELVNLPKGADVFSNEESKRMVGGQGITIETMNIKSGVDWEVGASYLAQKLRLS